jgi:hypothetical protein
MRLIILLPLALVLTACIPAPQLTPLPTETAIPSETATPTVVWFPPTSTWTPIPTVESTPTPELRPGIGEIVIREDFSTAEGWTLGPMPQGSAGLGVNELTLAITQPKGYLSSVSEGLFLTDLYAEITVSPSICSGMDEYGMLVRYEAPGYFYRFSLSCNGQVRLDRIIGGTAGSPQPWLPSASVPSAAPSSSRLGVWIKGKEMRFFVNDEFQFEVHDSYLNGGTLGVFARSAGETAVTVSFSDLVVYRVEE